MTPIENDPYSREIEAPSSPIPAPASGIPAAVNPDVGPIAAPEPKHDMKESAMAKAEEMKAAAVEKLEDVRQRVESSAHDLRARCEVETRANPGRTLGIAFGVGFLVGLMLRR